MVSIKIQGFIFLFLSLLVYFFFILISKEIKINYLRVLQSIIISFAIVSPWYIRSYVKTGDLFAKVGINRQVNVASSRKDASIVGKYLSRFFSYKPSIKDKESKNVFDPRGRTGKFYGIFFLPWDLSVHGSWRGFGDWVGPIFLSLLLSYFIFYRRLKNKYMLFNRIIK